MDLLQILCAGAGVAYLATAWKYGAVFARCRAWLEAVGGWPAELSSCSLCQSYWLALLVLLPVAPWNCALPLFYAPAAAGLGYGVLQVWNLLKFDRDPLLTSFQ